MINAMVHFASDYINFVDAVNSRGSVTAGNFSLRISEKEYQKVKYFYN